MDVIKRQDQVMEIGKKASVRKNKDSMSSEVQQIQPELITPAQRVRNDWRSFVDKVSYKAIVNNIPYLAFVAVLCVVYISNSHRAIEMQRELNAQNKILKELRWKYMDVKSQLMYVKTETQVIKNAEHIGLKPSLLPAYKIGEKK